VINIVCNLCGMLARNILRNTVKLSQLSLRTYHRAIINEARVTAVVPPLGESITSGSIAKWTKTEGDMLAVDDVVVIIETDKVTVDIKAEHAGKLLKKIATSENVSVGDQLYEMDTDAGAAGGTTKKKEESVKVDAPKKDSHVPTSSSKSNDHHTRKPLIKFLGKRNLLKKEDNHQDHSNAAINTNANNKSPASEKTTTSSTPSTQQGPTKPQTGVDFYTLKGGAWYGRPQISKKEMEAIESGGATDIY